MHGPLSVKNRNAYQTGGSGKRNPYTDSLRAGRFGDRIPVGVRFSAPVKNGSPGDHTDSYIMPTGSSQEIKRPDRGVNHPPPK